MLKCLTCASVIFVLVLSFLSLPPAATARRCPAPPKTLLSLYQGSDAIFIATFDKATQGETVEDNDDYTAVEVRKHFIVSSTLKGKSQKYFVLAEREYTYKNTDSGVTIDGEPPETELDSAKPEEEPDGPEEETEEYEEPDEMKSGDSVLLFVRRSDEGEDKGFRLTDYRDGLKRLTMDEIGVYEARIKELKSILSAKKVSAERMVAWLIRCADDPVTRWEGTYELLESVQMAEWRERQAAERRERLAKGEAVEDEPATTHTAPDEDVDDGGMFDTSVLADALTADHKQTLANILLNSYSPSSEREAKEHVRGDGELIELIKQWGDPRLLGFLLDQLRAGAGENWDKASRMGTIADILEDGEAKAIASKYSDNAWQEDDETVEDDDEEPADEADEPEQRDTERPAESEEPTEKEAAPAAAGHEKPKQMTYLELRNDLLQKFIAQCDKVIADRQYVKEEKAMR
jgi:hypothetical protein